MAATLAFLLGVWRTCSHTSTKRENSPGTLTNLLLALNPLHKVKYYLFLILYMLKASSVFAIAVAVATLVPVSIVLAGLGPNAEGVAFYNGADSRVEDARDDAKPVPQLNEPRTIPQVRDYHDIVGASVKKQGEEFLFTIELAGNPNNNENPETLYLWNVITDKHYYRILLPHFATGNNTTEEGWYFALFDVTDDTYVVQMTKISDMPQDRVQFSVKDFFIENPSSFRYWVAVHVRTSNTLVGPPDYLMDYAP
jgi:hypothetical protein